MDITNSQAPPPHIVIVPSPGMGHLIPLAEFAKLLHSNYHFSISILLPTATPPTAAQTTFLSTLPSAVSYTFLPPVDPTLMPSGDVAHEVIINITHLHSIPYLRDSLAALTRHTAIAALVTDIFGMDVFDVAREFGVPPYMYFTSTAMCLSFLLHLPTLHETVSCEYRDMKEPLVLPGCVPLHGKDFVDPVQDRKDQAYPIVLDLVKRYKLAEGIFVNTFMDLEPDALHALQNDPEWPSVYPVGPIIQTGSGQDADKCDCLGWLDRQPTGSVLFVSFGSGGTLSFEQLNELAHGLELSGQRFLWVIRSPEKTSHGSFFSGRSQDDPFSFLPKTFMERIKDRGLLVPSWAPQIKVLNHESTGGFLTHCGWNSTLESIVNGVPLIVWPLYAEQKMNAVMLNEGLKVALRPKAKDCGLVESDEIAKVVKELMEGEEGKKVRDRMMEISDSANKAKSEDGDSSLSLNQIALKWYQS